MKLSNIIHSTSLSENNDDMFPGVASSVFDDAKAKDQPEPDTNNLDWLNGQVDKYQSVVNVYFRKRDRILNDMEKNGARVYFGTAGSPRSDVIPYTSFDWFDNYNVLGIGKYYGIEKSSPYLKDIENTVRTLDGYFQREQFFRRKAVNFNSTIKKVAAKQRKGQKDASVTAFDSYAKNVIKLTPPSPIPNKLPVKNKRPINNPYVTANATKQYAGSVFNYPHWSPYWKNQIMQIEDILTRNGNGGLEMMYASNHGNRGARFNFVISGAAGKVTWRKYDPSPGAGQNWIILNGKKLNTSTLLKMDKAKQDQAVQSL